MKRRDLSFKPELDSIISKCEICNLAMVDEDGLPYVLPMNFGYKDDYIYFHSAQTGRKIDILKKNKQACISFSTDHDLKWVNEEVACSWSMRYRSVLVFGKVEFIDDHDQKEEALQVFMKNYSEIDFSFNRPAVTDVLVFRVKVEKLEGRAFGY